MVEDLFRAGKLQEAIAAATAEVKAQPTQLDARHTLFVLLLFMGDVERAEKQLDVIAKQEGQASTGPAVYQALLSAEWERRQVYEAAGTPTLPPEAPTWAQERLRALQLLRAGDGGAAQEAIAGAIAATPNFTGRVDGRDFDGFCDYDDVLGSVLELYAGGRYLWMPLSHVRKLTFKPAETAFDTLYRQAQIVDANGATAEVYLPVLYAGSHQSSREALKLGRETEWAESGELQQGVGQHVYLSVHGDEQVEHGLLEVSTLEIDEVS